MAPNSFLDAHAVRFLSNSAIQGAAVFNEGGRANITNSYFFRHQVRAIVPIEERRPGVLGLDEARRHPHLHGCAPPRCRVPRQAQAAVFNKRFRLRKVAQSSPTPLLRRIW